MCKRRLIRWPNCFGGVHRETLGAADGSPRGGTISIREAARRADREVKAVHGDVTEPIEPGIPARTTGGRIDYRYEAVKVELVLPAA